MSSKESEAFYVAWTHATCNILKGRWLKSFFARDFLVPLIASIRKANSASD